MEQATIQDWTDSIVLLKFDQHHDVSYRVYRDGEKNFLEVRDEEETHIHTLELPDGMKLDRTSYEVHEFSGYNLIATGTQHTDNDAGNQVSLPGNFDRV